MFALLRLQGVRTTHLDYITCMPARMGAIPNLRSNDKDVARRLARAHSAGACSPAEPGILLTRGPRRRSEWPRVSERQSLSALAPV